MGCEYSNFEDNIPQDWEHPRETDPWVSARTDLDQWTHPNKVEDVNESVLALGNLVRTNAGLDTMRHHLRYVLADADALLALVPFARHKKECQIARAWGNGPGGTFTEPHCNCGYEKALAALAEYLK